MTERAVEVPIMQRIVDAHAGARILEVGHVLGHYGPVDHVVVDKYEQAPGVLNLDVLELAPLGEFDLIVAISTLEHVGWDESPREPGKAGEALTALAPRLAPGGRLVRHGAGRLQPVLRRRPAQRRSPLRHRGGDAPERAGPHWREVAVPDGVVSALRLPALPRARRRDR